MSINCCAGTSQEPSLVEFEKSLIASRDYLKIVLDRSNQMINNLNRSMPTPTKEDCANKAVPQGILPSIDSILRDINDYADAIDSNINRMINYIG